MTLFVRFIFLSEHFTDLPNNPWGKQLPKQFCATDCNYLHLYAKEQKSRNGFDFYLLLFVISSDDSDKMNLK